MLFLWRIAVTIGNSMSNSVELKTLVDNWLKDVQRRGANLYAENLGNGVLYVTFQGKDQHQVGVKIDFDAHETTVQINGQGRYSVKYDDLLLHAESLPLLA